MQAFKVRRCDFSDGGVLLPPRSPPLLHLETRLLKDLNPIAPLFSLEKLQLKFLS